MRMTKTITLNSDQYLFIREVLDCEMIALEELNQHHEYDKKIKKAQKIIDLIDKAEGITL